MQLLFISWAPYCSRSDGIARRLGGESYMVYSPAWGSRYATVAFKYLWQAIKTLWLLVRKRPRVAFVMAPPVVACGPVWVYCALTGAKFVIDAHTGAFDNPRWERVQFLQRFFSRRAATTIVTGEHYRDVVRSWGADATIVTDVPVYFAEPAVVTLPEGPNLVLVSSFCHDEPLEEFLDAAGNCPEVNFHVTGDTSKLPVVLLQKAPSNVRFTGFLDDAEYVGLIQAADGVIALTTHDHTMQRAAYEAVYLGKPVITSDFPILRKAFPIGTVYVAPTASGVRCGINDFLANRERLSREVIDLCAKKQIAWSSVAAELDQSLQLSACNASLGETVQAMS